jgi:hypothetical protein
MSATAPTPQAFATLVLIACLMGGNHVAARMAFEHGVDVVTAVAVRSVVTALAVGVLVRLSRVSVSMNARQRGAMVLIGALVALQSVWLYSAVARLPVGLALLAFNTYPLWTAFWAWALYRHRPERAVLVAMPIILGRTAIRKRGILVDAGKSYLAGMPRPTGGPPLTDELHQGERQQLRSGNGRRLAVGPDCVPDHGAVETVGLGVQRGPELRRPLADQFAVDQHASVGVAHHGQVVVLWAGLMAAVGIGQVDERTDLLGPPFEAHADREVDEFLLHGDDEFPHPRVGEPAQERSVSERDPAGRERVGHQREVSPEHPGDRNPAVGLITGEPELRTQPAGGPQPGAALRFITCVQLGEHGRTERVHGSLSGLE